MLKYCQHGKEIKQVPVSPEGFRIEKISFLTRVFGWVRAGIKEKGTCCNQPRLVGQILEDGKVKLHTGSHLDLLCNCCGSTEIIMWTDK